MRPVESYSSLSTYETCPKLYDFKYNQGLTQQDETIASKFGTWMIHEPITRWYATGGQHQPDFDELWGHVQPTEAECNNRKNKSYTIKTARLLWDEYTSRFARDFDEYDIEAVEFYKIIDWYGSKADVVFKRRADGKKKPMDLKSSKWDAVLDGAHVNRQFLGQMYVSGTDEGIVTLLNPETLAIERIPIQVSPEAMSEFVRELEFRRSQIAASERAGMWPKNAPKSCRPFNRDCPMKVPCHGA